MSANLHGAQLVITQFTYLLMNGLHVVLNIPFKTLCSAREFSFKRCLWTK